MRRSLCPPSLSLTLRCVLWCSSRPACVGKPSLRTRVCCGHVCEEGRERGSGAKWQVPLPTPRAPGGRVPSCGCWESASWPWLRLKLCLSTVCSVFQLPAWTMRYAHRGQGTSEGLTTHAAASVNLCQGKDSLLDWRACSEGPVAPGWTLLSGHRIRYLTAVVTSLSTVTLTPVTYDARAPASWEGMGETLLSLVLPWGSPSSLRRAGQKLWSRSTGLGV